MFIAQNIESWIVFAGALLVTWHAYRPIPVGAKQPEWVAWQNTWGRIMRVLGPFVLVTTVVHILVTALAL